MARIPPARILRSSLAIALLITLLIGASAPAAAAPQRCKTATAAFRDTVRDVRQSLAAYQRCIQRSDGRDDCSGDFLFLQGAQSNYEEFMERARAACH